ncbi:MAG: N-acetylmuramoyl-L-alanine amidase [Ruminococcaceae bacterium]|nr:N-acetylmuramoyl-L-alanine amidase [Oscillospiraceae bacterium]
MAIKIFIDQGHNPTNPNAGAEGNGLREQDLTFEIGILLAELLENDPNYEVRVSRPSLETQLGTTNAQSLRIRTDEANNWGADYFISLHANASSIASASGSEGYVYSLGGAAEQLAENILVGLTASTGLPDRGVFARPTLYVLRKTRMPATLIELGFITNSGDAALMSENPQLFAQGIYNGLNRYFGLA